MSKHPGPWATESVALVDGSYILDANGKRVGKLLTDDHETRAVLLHAGEMFRELQVLCDSSRSTLDDDLVVAGELLSKIEFEIAKGKP